MQMHIENGDNAVGGECDMEADYKATFEFRCHVEMFCLYRKFGEHGEFGSIDIYIRIVLKELLSLIPSQKLRSESAHPCGFLQTYDVGIGFENILHLFVIQCVAGLSLSGLYKVMYVVGEECKTLGTLRYLVCAYVERKVGEHRAEATQQE